MKNGNSDYRHCTGRWLTHSLDRKIFTASDFIIFLIEKRGVKIQELKEELTRLSCVSIVRGFDGPVVRPESPDSPEPPGKKLRCPSGCRVSWRFTRATFGNIMKKLLYLASPYSHPDPEVMRHRCREAQKAAARLMLEGYAVFAPIAQSHGIADYMPESLRRSQDFWLGQDLPLLSRCDALVVLRLPGWEDSLGMKMEISFARAAKIPVIFRDPDTAEPGNRKVNDNISRKQVQAHGPDSR